MKKIIAFLFAVLLVSVASVCAATLEFGWNYADMSLVDGFRLFAHLEGGVYDYTAPKYDGVETTCTVTYPPPSEYAVPSPTGIAGAYDKAAAEITISWNQELPPVVSKTYNAVVRAYKGDLESEDSNEVTYTLTWEGLKQWVVYDRLAPADAWVEFAVVPYGSTTITQAFTAVPDGTSQSVEFTLVSFGVDGVYSPDAAVVAVTIDRTPDVPGPPTELHTITITVE